MLRKKISADEHQGSDELSRNGAVGLARLSIIVYFLDKLSDKIYDALINGFFGYIFTAYSSEIRAYNDGFVVSFFYGGSRWRKLLRRFREYLSCSFETSFILKKLKIFVCRLAFVPLKLYGSFLLAFGSYTLLIYFMHLALPITGKADSDYIYIGASVCIISLPMYFSSLNLAQAVKQGRITSALFIDVFGYKDDNFENKYGKKTARPAISILLGLGAGLSTFFVHPLLILAVLLTLALCSIIVITPEIGVLLAIFGLPFFSFASNPTMVLTALVLVTTFSYIIKLVRGKRIFKLELLDIAVLFFVAMMLLSGVVTVGGRPSYNAALISSALAFGYFLVVNLIRTETWLKRCSVALVSSGAAVALIGILQYLMGNSVNDWLDRSYFPDIEGRATSLFENPNYLGAYFALVLPVAIYNSVTAKSRNSRILGFIVCTMMTVCTVLTWSRGAWLALIVSVMIFFIVFSRKTMRALYCIVAAIPFLPFVLPSNVVSRFMSIGNMADSSTSYRVYTWRGSIDLLKDHLWGGIGYGAEAFERVYPAYAYAGMEGAVHSHSLYLQVLISMGIVGLVCFATVILFYFQKSFEYMKSPISRDNMLFCAAAVCSTLALLIMGLFDYVWYNYRVFFLFWVVLALGVSAVRIGKRELTRLEVYENISATSAYIEIS